MRIKATIEGAEDFIELNNKLSSTEVYDKVLEEVATKIYALTVLYAPRKTGALENSIQLLKSGRTYILVVNVPYAEYMEYGTRFFPVGTASSPRARTSTSGKACYHPFMRTALWEVMNEFPSYIQRILFGKF
jgi:hypothetical protein